MKHITHFQDGNKDMKNLLGGKGANLCELTKLKMPVPQGFIINTDTCIQYYDDAQTLPEQLKEEVMESILTLNRITGKTFGNKDNPLLVSVRSGARASMPGMMDTILNLGLNDEIVEVMAKKQGKFAYDAYRRFIEMYSDVVKNIPTDSFVNRKEAILKEYKIESDHDLNQEALKKLIEQYQNIYQEYTNEPFPQDPELQLLESIEAVFRSWFNPRATYYRTMNHIPHTWGTAVIIQEMVFGNTGSNSSTGVFFSRNPANGDNTLYGEYLINAQGEDVVAGTHTPKSFDQLKENNPKLYKQLEDIAKTLEQHYGDMQDMEFTVENGTLYILQTRNGKRAPQAAIKIANDFINEGIISIKDAIKTIDPSALDHMLHPSFKKEQLINPIGKGLPASPGAATGHIALTAQKVEEDYEQGIPCILVRKETSPDDIKGMHLSNGILTSRGGLTSHAAVVTRGIGKPCIVGSNDLHFSEDSITINNQTFKEGDTISIDGQSGLIYKGTLDIVEAEISQDLIKLLKHVEKDPQFTVLANADLPEDIEKALEMGAKGIGLIRTEHMFFEPKRLELFQEMILSDNEEQRAQAIKEILPIQTQDFYDIFKKTKTLPATIRLLDPPLHEFMPTEKTAIKHLAKKLDIKTEKLIEQIESQKEFNPMMGHRGCRLAISYPEIPLMQVEAIIKAAQKIKEEDNIDVTPKIMIPLIGTIEEFKYLKDIIQKHIKTISQSTPYKIGTMIELPRACMIADQLAPEVDFFSFGTNDLTQMTYGLSRDDASKFLENYFKKQIYLDDPFSLLDKDGVLELMKIAINKAKQTNKNIEIGICGEHAGDPRSIELLKTLDLNTISCSPFRIPLARLKAY